MPDDVEFLVDEPAGAEVLTAGGLPRWLVPVAALATVGLLAAGVVTDRTRAAPARRPVAASAPFAASAAPPADVLDAAAAGPDGVWLLGRHTLRLVAGTRTTERATVLPLPHGRPRLVADPGAGRLWVVTEGARPARLVEFATAGGLHRLRDLSIPPAVSAAVAYRGRLYLATARGVVDLAPEARAPVPVPGLTGPVRSLVLDAARGRILVAGDGYRTQLWAYRPGRRPVAVRRPLPLADVTLAVAGTAVWVGGFGAGPAGGAAVERLDPVTLEPVLHSPAAASFDPGAVIIGAGRDALWVVSGADDGRLSCLDASTGRVRRVWGVSGATAVVSTSLGTVVVTQTGALAVLSSRCPVR